VGTRRPIFKAFLLEPIDSVGIRDIRPTNLPTMLIAKIDNFLFFV